MFLIFGPSNLPTLKLLSSKRKEMRKVVLDRGNFVVQHQKHRASALQQVQNREITYCTNRRETGWLSMPLSPENYTADSFAGGLLRSIVNHTSNFYEDCFMKVAVQ